ncbi:hypothetical protein [Lysinibacillus telephonicus]|uniref:hypothetical protein n=1 Tax=Lysinibacillus telephonicus TaxID=1714840 RepID=UPI0037D03DCF
MQKHVFDAEGNYQGLYHEGVVLEDGDQIIETEIVNGQFHKPKLVNGEVVEGLSQEEIDAINNAPNPKTQEDYLLDLDFRLSVVELGLI